MARVIDAILRLQDQMTAPLSKATKQMIETSKQAQRMGKDIQRAGKDIEKLGGSLSKRITLPAIAAGTAIVGMVSSFGWSRLTAMDEAQSKLKGLGYEAEAVARITTQVREAIQGSITTMAEGTSIAAGALAAGVKEGEDLSRFIKLVGSAAVGSGRQVGDMAQIFNRVQGAGKLMTQELNMVEDGMPGFSQAMAKHLGVPQEKFRKMVTSGKVSSAQFLDVMEDFAGGMAAAYADSWKGMVANTKSNIGIIGEKLLGGVFEKSKESISEFLSLLRSDGLRTWAANAGEAIGKNFTIFVDKLKATIKWFRALSPETQQMIGKIALFAIAAGPAITILGKLTTGVGKAFVAYGKFGAALKKAGSVFALITSPANLVVLAIVAIAVAAFLIIKNWDKIKATFKTVGKYIRSVLESVGVDVDKLKETFVAMKGPIMSIVKHIVKYMQILWKGLKIVISFVIQAIKGAMPIIIAVIGKWISIMAPIVGGIFKILDGVITFITGVFTGDWKSAWEGVKKIFGGIFEGLAGLLKVPMNAVIGIINKVIGKINGLKIEIPDWVPGLGGKKFNLNISPLPLLYKGTNNWVGGPAIIHDRGAEIVDLPRGSRVYPHDKSLQMARQEGQKSASKNGSNITVSKSSGDDVLTIKIEKIADTIVVQNDQDIQKIADQVARQIVQKVKKAKFNMGEVY